MSTDTETPVPPADKVPGLKVTLTPRPATSAPVAAPAVPAVPKMFTEAEFMTKRAALIDATKLEIEKAKLAATTAAQAETGKLKAEVLAEANAEILRKQQASAEKIKAEEKLADDQVQQRLGNVTKEVDRRLKAADEKIKADAKAAADKAAADKAAADKAAADKAAAAATPPPLVPAQKRRAAVATVAKSHWGYVIATVLALLVCVLGYQVVKTLFPKSQTPATDQTVTTQAADIANLQRQMDEAKKATAAAAATATSALVKTETEAQREIAGLKDKVASLEAKAKKTGTTKPADQLVTAIAESIRNGENGDSIVLDYRVGLPADLHAIEQAGKGKNPQVVNQAKAKPSREELAEAREKESQLRDNIDSLNFQVNDLENDLLHYQQAIRENETTSPATRKSRRDEVSRYEIKIAKAKRERAEANRELQEFLATPQ